LLGGVAVALAPDIRVAAAPSAQVETLAAKDVLPTAADCLSLYLPILERIKQDILHSYYTRVGCLAGEVRNRYLELQKHVKEFERLVPQLQADRKTSEIKNATQWGETSAAGIKQMAEGGVIFMDAHLALMSYSSERLNEGIAEWQKQRGSLTLSPEAVKLLRTILQEVRDLDQSTDSLDKTSKVLTNIDETLGGEVSKIKANIQLAISKLVTSELSKQESSAAEWDEAKQFVQTAIGQLQALDAFVPPQTFKDLVNQNSFKAAQCLTAPAQSDSDPSAPTKNLRTLLEGAVQWIDGGFQLSRGDDTPHGGATFIKASMNASMAPVWLQTFFTVRQILQSILPDGSNGRAWGCLGLITVPHVAERDVAKRAMLIYGLLPNLSAGRVAMTDERRRLLAQRLAELSI
jgi:hypothetical protein